MSPPEGIVQIRKIISQADDGIPRLCPLSAAEFLALELPPRELILGPWLPQKGLAMLHSPRGIGKTYFGLSVGLRCSQWRLLSGFPRTCGEARSVHRWRNAGRDNANAAS